MQTLRMAAAAVLLAGSWASNAQTAVSCGQTLDAPFRSRAELTIDSRPASLEIVGTDQETIRVSCSADDTDIREHTRLRFSGAPDLGKLTITDSHRKSGGLHIRIEVPRKVNLGIEMPAGQVDVKEIVGNKDIELYAGQITISSSHAWDYRKVDVSVGIGEVDAQVYGSKTGGFFRSFRSKDTSGEFQLQAHLTTGQIRLVGKNLNEPD